MQVSPYLLLGIYSAGFIVFIIMSLFSVYHILRFGFSRKLGMAVTVVYLLIVIVVLIITWQLLLEIDWSDTLEIELPFTENTDDPA